jgi:hypothetical protein
MGWKQLLVPPLTIFNSSHWWIDIVFTKNGICILVNIVIVYPTCVNILPWFCIIQGFVTSNAIQAKKKELPWPTSMNSFLLLTIEVFRCLHKQNDVFLHECANATWSFKRPKGPSPFYVGYFSSSRNFNYIIKDVSIFHLKLSSNSKLSYLWLPPLHDTPPITTVDLLKGIGCWNEHAHVGGCKRLHVALKCCWKKKVLLLIRIKASRRKGCWSTMNLAIMIRATKVQLPK